MTINIIEYMRQETDQRLKETMQERINAYASSAFPLKSGFTEENAAILAGAFAAVSYDILITLAVASSTGRFTPEEICSCLSEHAAENRHKA